MISLHNSCDLPTDSNVPDKTNNAADFVNFVQGFRHLVGNSKIIPMIF